MPSHAVSAVRQYGFTDKLVTLFVLIGISVPSFWLGLSFEVGMLAAVLERPCARAAQLGRWWDFSFGADPQRPPSEVRRSTLIVAAVAAVSAAGGVAWAAWLE